MSSPIGNAMAGKCPMCGEGDAFDGILSMKDACDACGVRFDRDPGFFTGAVTLPYMAASVWVCGLLGVVFLTGQLNAPWLTGAVVGSTLVFVALAYPPSKRLWLGLYGEWGYLYPDGPISQRQRGRPPPGSAGLTSAEVLAATPQPTTHIRPSDPRALGYAVTMRPLLPILVCACTGRPLEGADPATCANGEDDDRNGVADCADPGCRGAPICELPGATTDSADTGELDRLPVVDAGPDLVGLPPGSTVRLQGTVEDPEGGPLTIRWFMGRRPKGSVAQVVPRGSLSPLVQLDRTGTYLVELRVDDGRRQVADTVALQVANGDEPPSAAATAPRRAVVDETVVLNGSASSDPEGAALTYRWRVAQRPSDSTAEVQSDPLQPGALLTPDAVGLWAVELIVSDGGLTSPPVLVRIQVVAD